MNEKKSPLSSLKPLSLKELKDFSSQEEKKSPTLVMDGYQNIPWETLESIYETDAFAFLKRCVLKRKKEFFSGRYLLHQLMEQKGWPSNDPILRHSLSGYALVPQPFRCSLSHSHKYAAALIVAADDYLSVGLDIEKQISQKTFNSINKTILTEEELSQLSSWAPSLEVTTKFSTLFSAKETLYKTVNPLINKFFDFHAYQCTQWDSEKKELTFKLNSSLIEELKPYSSFIVWYKIFDGHILTLAGLSRTHRSENQN